MTSMKGYYWLRFVKLTAMPVIDVCVCVCLSCRMSAKATYRPTMILLLTPERIPTFTISISHNPLRLLSPRPHHHHLLDSPVAGKEARFGRLASPLVPLPRVRTPHRSTADTVTTRAEPEPLAASDPPAPVSGPTPHRSRLPRPVRIQLRVPAAPPAGPVSTPGRSLLGRPDPALGVRMRRELSKAAAAQRWRL